MMVDDGVTCCSGRKQQPLVLHLNDNGNGGHRMLRKSVSRRRGMAAVSASRRPRRTRVLLQLILLLGAISAAPNSGVADAFQLSGGGRIRHLDLKYGQKRKERISSPSALRASRASKESSIPVVSFHKSKELERRIVQLGRQGKTKEALAVFRMTPSPSVRMWNAALDACARARPTRLDEALRLFQENSQKLRPNVFTFGALLSACSRAKRSDKAMELLRDMEPKYGVTPNAVVYSSAISACARSLQKDMALKLLREAVEERNLDMSVVGFNAAISACAQAGDWENAISLLERMEAANRRDDEGADDEKSELRARVPAPDKVTYGTVLSACEKAGQWERLLQSVPKHEEMDALALTSCLHACQQLGLASEAIGYMDRMKNLAQNDNQQPKTMGWDRCGAKSPLRGPDAVAYRLAISACARGGAWEEGLRLLDELEQLDGGTGADVVAYTSAITGCEYAGEWRQAFVLLDRMRKHGVAPNEVTMAAVLGACATACAQINKAKKDGSGSSEEIVDDRGMLLPQRKALQILRVMKKDPSVVDPNIQVYNAAIRACAEAYDLKRAMKLFDEIKEKNIPRTIVTYGSLMTACERVGCVQSASKVFRSLKDENDLVPNEIIYGAAISCCRKAKESERAFLLLRKMIHEGLSPNVVTFNTVLVAQTEGNPSRQDLERALMLYKIMKSNKIPGMAKPSRQTYTLLIQCLSANQQPALAEAFLTYMRDDGFVPEVDLYTVTVTGYERIGQPLKALQLMQSMQEKGYDFYNIPVLDTAFKKALKLVNVVGRGLGSKSRNNADLKQINDSLPWSSEDDPLEPESDQLMTRQTN